MRPRRRELLSAVVGLGLVAALPLLSLMGHPGAFLADADSELPVKLWAHHHFWTQAGYLGGEVAVLSWPQPGPLNNAELAATAWFAAWRPLVGEAFAWNGYIFCTLWANMLSMWAAARPRVNHPAAALFAAVAWGLTPLALAYGVMSAITDVLQLWPYPLAVHLALRALGPQGRLRDAALSGLLLGLGFWTCLYNVMVFLPLVLPVLTWVALQGEARPGLRQLVQVGLAVGLGFGVLAGPLLGWTLHLMAAGNSQMSEELVASTRHLPPFPSLRPEVEDRYTAFLADYLAVGSDAMGVRDLGSRFYRAFSPGWLVLGLGLLGLCFRPHRREAALWSAVGLFFLLASTGPFLPVTATVSSPLPLNPAWWACYVLPGGKMLLEPFRYGLPAAMGLALAAACGVDTLAPRLRAWTWLLLPAFLAELILLSPLPIPLPVARPEVPAAYHQLDAWLPPGALIELPYFEAGSGRFYREHLLHQRKHGRAIGTGIAGFPPPYYVENGLLQTLLATEDPLPIFGLRGQDSRRFNRDLQALRDDGFVGIVLTPTQYKSAAHAEAAGRLLSALGTPIVAGDQRIYRLHPGGPVSTRP